MHHIASPISERPLNYKHVEWQKQHWPPKKRESSLHLFKELLYQFGLVILSCLGHCGLNSMPLISKWPHSLTPMNSFQRCFKIHWKTLSPYMEGMESPNISRKPLWSQTGFQLFQTKVLHPVEQSKSSSPLPQLHCKWTKCNV